MDPLSAESYRSIAADTTPKSAYLHQIAVQRNQTQQEAVAADNALSLEHNPFSYKDDHAVGNGAVIYAAHCATCHGADASGVGPAMPVGTSKTNFHNIHKKMFIQMTGHAPATWASAVYNGQTSSSTGPDDRPLVMPPFKDVLSREQIWLAVTFLEHVTLHPDQVLKK